MTQWVRTDYEFNPRMANLWVSDRTIRRWINLPGLVEIKPEEVEKIIYDVIEELRPDLIGGVLIGIKYELGRLCWEFWYIHRSLPEVPMGDRPPSLPLIPE